MHSCSGATRLSGRFNEGFSLRRLPYCEARRRGIRFLSLMRYMTMANLKIIGVLAALGTVGFTFAIGAYPPSAHAQTQGMDRRDDRRDTRQDSRDVKQACKAGDEKT